MLAGAATVLSLGTLAAAFAITGSQGDRPPWWFVLVVALASVGLGYGTVRAAHRRTVLFSASGGLGVMGVRGLLTIGLPLLVAAAMTHAYPKDLTRPTAS